MKSKLECQYCDKAVTYQMNYYGRHHSAVIQTCDDHVGLGVMAQNRAQMIDELDRRAELFRKRSAVVL